MLKNGLPDPSLVAQVPPREPRKWLCFLPELLCHLCIYHGLCTLPGRLLPGMPMGCTPPRLVLTLYSVRASLTFPGYRLQHLPCHPTLCFLPLLNHSPQHLPPSAFYVMYHLMPHSPHWSKNSSSAGVSLPHPQCLEQCLMLGRQ